MISLYDGELVDILPDELKNQPEYAAISYAIKKSWQKLHQYAARASVFACIDDLPEEMLDILAIEMRAQYYDQSFLLDTKRSIVRQAILWNVKAGTKYAVDNVIQAIYGGGEVIDWYDYSGTPGHFKLLLEAVNTYDFMKIIGIMDGIKRKSAKLDEIELILRTEQRLFYGTITAFNVETELKTEYVDVDAYTWYADEHLNLLSDQNENILIV